MEYTGRYWHDGHHCVEQDSMCQTAVISRIISDGFDLKLVTVLVSPSWNDAIIRARELTRVLLRETV